jgi:hypothetical protein
MKTYHETEITSVMKTPNEKEWASKTEATHELESVWEIETVPE